MFPIKIMDLLEITKSYVAGAIAACMAVTITNPAEVIKTRMQLEGELQKRTTSAPAPSFRRTFSNILKYEGIFGLQRGLAPAYIYQIFLNGIRFGMYDSIKFNIVSGLELINVQNAMVSSMAAGAISGVLGAFSASPWLLIKTRMQSYTKGAAASIGHQHTYVEKGTFHSLKTIFKTQGGFIGLWRGADASMLRTGIGSSVQVPSYEFFKEVLLREEIFSDPKSPKLHIAASFATGLAVCTVMNPFDVAMTRMVKFSLIFSIIRMMQRHTKTYWIVWSKLFNLKELEDYIKDFCRI
jgi:solute carrier family 25, member 34/35